jgi:hypothetical protein
VSLSVCCLTNDRPALVAAMMALFRPVADELVVAVDHRVDPRSLGPLAAVVDTLVRFEYDATPERARPWLVATCSGDTVVMIDGDEVPSQALLAVLPELVADRQPEQFRLTRRWTFPDERTWLAERPWFPDLQRRILRPGPRLDFDLRFHGGAREVAPSRIVPEPIYHLACTTRSLGDRRRTARAYDAARPGLMAVGGGPMNATLYAPEHFATRPLAATPPADIAAIREVLAATDPALAPVGRFDGVPIVGTAEIDTHVPADPLLAQGYAAALRVVEVDLRTDPGNDTHVLVEITNTGRRTIHREDVAGAQVRVVTRLTHPEPGRVPDRWARTVLPCDVPAGESRVVEAIVHVPDRPGRYGVEVDLLNERARPFGAVTTAELLVATRWDRYALEVPAPAPRTP